MSKLQHRIDFIYLFDVQDGNPNGDPDAGNLPRIDAETGNGLVTDVCLKRKIRNYVEASRQDNQHYGIFIQEAAVLDNRVEEIYETDTVKNSPKTTQKETAKKALCEKYFDIRTFGAVIATKEKQGQVRGPVQLTFARSIDPVVSLSHAITRMAVTKESDKDKERTIGRKSTIPYGLYMTHGFINVNLAEQTGFDSNDLDLFWEALKNMFDHDRSAARGLMSARKLIIFEHDSNLGNAPANTLFDLVTIQTNDGVLTPRSFKDYVITINRDDLPVGVQIKELL